MRTIPSNIDIYSELLLFFTLNCAFIFIREKILFIFVFLRLVLDSFGIQTKHQLILFKGNTQLFRYDNLFRAHKRHHHGNA